MTNQHIAMASANLRRAAQDLRLDEQRIHNDIENAKRDATKKIATIESRMAAFQKERLNHIHDANRIIAIDMETHNLTINIAKIHKDTTDYEIRMRSHMSNIERQVNELESTASHIDRMG